MVSAYPPKMAKTMNPTKKITCNEYHCKDDPHNLRETADGNASIMADFMWCACFSN
jgi:hypothetical protein